MINSEDFYGLIPGTIGVLKYSGRTTAPSEELISEIQQDMASSMFSAYLSNYAMLQGGGQDVDPQTAFENARKKAKEEAERIATTPVTQEFHVQIGQEESIQKMIELEQSEAFIGWSDPNMANLIKTTI
jgi:hypothetical protein